ncbi:MAG: hypothetical protein O7D88_07320, partial [Gammaproteobacteria bacterium]|nr:hypothetical protein [Gammaproteobacteria bacterium]
MDEENMPEPQTVEEPAISDHQMQMALETLRSEQSLLVGTLAGFVASLAGAGVWAAVTVLTEYQIGWMAVGIGVLVGFSMRFAGKGIDQTFGIAGA